MARTNVVGVSLDNEEKFIALKMASGEGLSISAYFRRLLLREAKRTKLTTRLNETCNEEEVEYGSEE